MDKDALHFCQCWRHWRKHSFRRIDRLKTAAIICAPNTKFSRDFLNSRWDLHRRTATGFNVLLHKDPKNPFLALYPLSILASFFISCRKNQTFLLKNVCSFWSIIVYFLIGFTSNFEINTYHLCITNWLAKASPYINKLLNAVFCNLVQCYL